MQKQVELKAKDVSRKAITLSKDKTLLNARNAMLRYNITRIIILDSKTDKALGIITEKDIGRFLYTKSLTIGLDEITLNEAMTTKLIAVNKEADLHTCASQMLENKISSVIVNNDNGTLYGIITKTDLANQFAMHYAGRFKVQDFMTKKIITVLPDDRLHLVLLTMVGNKISRVVVVENERPIGIITERDLLPLGSLVEPRYYAGFEKSDFKVLDPSTIPMHAFIPSGIKAIMLARDIMKQQNLVTISKDADLADAAELMLRNGISGLPVVAAAELNDDNNKLVGIVTKSDIVRALANQKA